MVKQTTTWLNVLFRETKNKKELTNLIFPQNHIQLTQDTASYKNIYNSNLLSTACFSSCNALTLTQKRRRLDIFPSPFPYNQS